MKRRRLFWQLFPSYLVIVILSLLAVSWYASVSMRRFYFEQRQDDLVARAFFAEQVISELLQQGDHASVGQYCNDLGRATDTRITVVLPDGRTIGDTEEDPAAMANHADRPEIKAAFTGQTGIALRYSQTVGFNMMYVAIPVISDGQIIGAIRTSVSIESIYDALGVVLGRIAVAGTIIAFFAAAIGLIAARRMTAPLEELRAGADRFAKGDLDHEISGNGSLEVEALADSMNKMASELNDRMRTVTKQKNEQQAVLASMTEAVIAVDISGKIVILNRAAAGLIQAEQERCIGKAFMEVVRNYSLQRFLESALGKTEPVEQDMIFQKDGQEKFLKGQAVPLRGGNGESIGVLLVLNDFTELMRLETVRRDFVANVSHELKTPVTSIKGFVETIIEGNNSEEEISRFLQIIRKQTNQMAAIIDDLLSLSRLEQDGKSMPLVEMDLSGPITGAVEICQVKADQKNIRIDTDIEPDCMAKINEPLMEQAVINLLDNAIKYSTSDSIVRVSCNKHNGYALISVADEGAGIEQKHLERIFERFYRVDKARSRKVGGTGLGLSIVKHIAQEHGGYVTVESTVGKGSRFFLHIPVS